MRKFLLILVASMLYTAPIFAFPFFEADNFEQSSNVIRPVGKNHVNVNGANGEILEIFNLTGTKVSEIRIDSSDKEIALKLPKGCYILKVKNTVRKISIQ